MDISYYIAKKLIKNGNIKNSAIHPIIQIASLAISLGIAIMIIALSIVNGFQFEIREKIIGFGGHIQIHRFDSQNTYEGSPIEKDSSVYLDLLEIPEITHIQAIATKAGIIKNNKEIYGVIVKGVDKDYNWDFFQKKLISGKIPNLTTSSDDELLISSKIAEKMQLETGKKLFLYFIQNDGRLKPKNFIISGVYRSGLEQYDKLYILTSISHIQKRNDWTENQVGKFEVFTKKFSNIDDIGKKVYENIPYDLHAATIKEQNPDLFSWLNLQDLNVIIIVVLMIVVATINIISALLILILDRTYTIGTLKTIGLSNWNIRKIFLFQSGYLIIKGMFWGNLFGLIICFVQWKFKLIKLDEALYYISEVPIRFDFMKIILLNIGTLIVCITSLILPSFLITKISPIKAIRYN